MFYYNAGNCDAGVKDNEEGKLKKISTHLLTRLKTACYIINRTKQKATKLVSIERRNDL